MSTSNNNNYMLQKSNTAVNAECTTTLSNYIKQTEDEKETLSTFEGSLAFISS